jgi:hypothetical protein
VKSYRLYRQESYAALGLVNSVFDQAVGRNVLVLVAEFVGLAQESRKFAIVAEKFPEQLLWGQRRFALATSLWCLEMSPKDLRVHPPTLGLLLGVRAMQDSKPSHFL